MPAQIVVVVLSTFIFLGIVRAYISIARTARRCASAKGRFAAALLAYFVLVGSAFGFGLIFERVGYSGETLVLVWVMFFIAALVLGKILFLNNEQYSTLFERKP